MADDQQGATSADTEPAATAGNDTNDDQQAQQMLADATAKASDDEPLGEAGEKALKAERKARKAAEAKAKAKEYEDRDKSELQKATEKLQAAQTEAQQARIEAMRLKVAQNKGLPAALAARLQGSSEDEMATDADELLAAMPQQTSGGRQPVESLQSGSLPAGEQARDMNEWMRGRAPRQ